MKKILLFAMAIALATQSFAAGVVVPSAATPSTISSVAVAPSPAPAVKASDIILPVGNTGRYINLQDLADIKVADYEKLSGKKMRWLDRYEFKLAQKKLRNSINEDGTVNNNKLVSMAAGKKGGDGTTGFHLGGFALGLFLGLIGVIIAYVIKDEKKKNRTKWAWIGWVTAIVLYVLIAIAA